MNRKNILISTLSILLVIGALLGGGCAAGPPAAAPASTQMLGNVTPQEAFNLIQENQNNPDFVILDVRTPEEFAEGHIENAVNIDFYAVTFRSQLRELDKNKTYLVYCRSGNRSGQALKIMAELNFMEALNMWDGILGWTAANLPVVK